jgi:MoxR-like ATPase
VVVTYPTEEEEKKIMQLVAKTSRLPALTPVIQPDKILAMRALVDQIHVDDQITEYIIRLVFATRQPAKFAPDLNGKIRFGGSPRASIYLNLAAKAHAFLCGRGYVTPQDVKSIAMDVLRHRVITTFEAEADEVTSEHIVKHLLDNIQVP